MGKSKRTKGFLLKLKTLFAFQDWRLNEYGGNDSAASRLMDKIEAKVIKNRFYPTYMWGQTQYLNGAIHFLFSFCESSACDQLAVAAAIDPRSVASQSQHYASVELTGHYTRGQMVVDYHGYLKKSPNVYLIDAMNVEVFKKMMLWSVDHPTVDYCPPSNASTK